MEAAEISASRIPTERPGSDGTLEWAATTLVIVDFARAERRWSEEPVSSDDLDGLRLIRDSGPFGMDISAGEHGCAAPCSRRMCAAGAVDVLQADASRCGGITGFLLVDAINLPSPATLRPRCTCPPPAPRCAFATWSGSTTMAASSGCSSTARPSPRTAPSPPTPPAQGSDRSSAAPTRAPARSEERLPAPPPPNPSRPPPACWSGRLARGDRSEGGLLRPPSLRLRHAGPRRAHPAPQPRRPAPVAARRRAGAGGWSAPASPP